MLKQLRIEYEIVRGELCRAAIRQRIERRKFLHDGVKPVRRDLIIRKRRPNVASGRCELGGCGIVDRAEAAEVAGLHGCRGHREDLGQSLVNAGALIVAEKEGLVPSVVDLGQIPPAPLRRTRTGSVDKALWDGRN